MPPYRRVLNDFNYLLSWEYYLFRFLSRRQILNKISYEDVNCTGRCKFVMGSRDGENSSFWITIGSSIELLVDFDEFCKIVEIWVREKKISHDRVTNNEFHQFKLKCHIWFGSLVRNWWISYNSVITWIYHKSIVNHKFRLFK